MSNPAFQDIVGQEQAIERLQRGLRGGRLPHALLFAGPAGVGRRTTALALARTLLCSEAMGQQPAGGKKAEATFIQACGRCDDCRMSEAGSHPDLNLIYKELARYHDDAQVRSRVMQDLSIAVIRDFLIARAGRSPARGRGKVFIVLEADLMSIAAQNALLKTLEEPPSGVTIILISQRPEQLLPTTLSRCAMIRFGLLPRQFVLDKLIECGMEQAEAAFWASFTAGSVGRASRLAGQGMYEVKCELIDKLSQLGPEGDAQLGEHLTKVADALATKAVAEAKKADGAELSKTLAARLAAGAMLELIAEAYRDGLGLAAGAERPITNQDQLTAVKALAGRFRPEQLAEIIEALSRCEQLLWRNVNPRIVWDNVAITCSSARPLSV